MSERLIVNVDLDGVLANFESTLEAGVRALEPSLPLPPRHLDFYMSRRTDNPQLKRAINQVKDALGFFAGLAPIEGALDGWQRIAELGYHPRILSAPLLSNPWCVEEKLAWIDTYLGPQAVDEAIIDKNKIAHGGIALIDDRPVVSGAENAVWQHIVFTQPYNQHIDTEYRLNNWCDPSLTTLLARCALRY